MTSRVEANAASEKPPPMDFARQTMSGLMLEIFARAAAGQLRARLHFVENQQRAVLLGDFAQSLVIAVGPASGCRRSS